MVVKLCVAFVVLSVCATVFSAPQQIQYSEPEQSQQPQPKVVRESNNNYGDGSYLFT